MVVSLTMFGICCATPLDIFSRFGADCFYRPPRSCIVVVVERVKILLGLTSNYFINRNRRDRTLVQRDAQVRA